MIYTSLLHLTQLKRNQEMANIHSMLEPKIRVKLAGNITIKCYDALITREHFFITHDIYSRRIVHIYWIFTNAEVTIKEHFS